MGIIRPAPPPIFGPDGKTIVAGGAGALPWEQAHKKAAESGAPPYDPLTAHTWRVFCLFDEANITHAGGAVSDANNQGTGADFAQAVAGSKPTFSADHYGAGLDAITLDGGDFLKSASDINYDAATWTTVFAGTCTDVGVYRRAIDLGAVVCTAGLEEASGKVFTYHNVDVGVSARLGTSNRADLPTYVIVHHDPSQAGASEVTIRVNGAAEDGGNAGFANNNTVGISAAVPVRIGIFNDEASFGWVGPLRFIGVAVGLITGADLTNLETWLADQVGL